MTALPNFDPALDAFEYQKTLVNGGFSYVVWTVGREGGRPTEALSGYMVDDTLPPGGTLVSPTALVQVVLFPPPDPA